MLRTYKDLIAWKKAFALCGAVYSFTRQLPADERFGLVSQLRRAAVSVPSNIAEGYGRGSTKDYLRFLWQANGSLCELETQLLLAQELGLVRGDECDALLANVTELGRVLAALIRALRAKVSE